MIDIKIDPAKLLSSLQDFQTKQGQPTQEQPQQPEQAELPPVDNVFVSAAGELVRVQRSWAEIWNRLLRE